MRRGGVWMVMILMLSACNKNDAINADGGSWLIPAEQVFDGGPGRDGIPALDNPARGSVAIGDYLTESELVLGYYDGTDAIAYPHQILDWHEIINDDLNGFPFAITYCPLTGTGIGWERTLQGKVTTFGVSGLIYNNNLIPFDRETSSNWSQARLDCVNGELINTKIKTFQLVETSWGTWKAMYPGTSVVTKETNHNRPYGTYPYGDYKTNENNILFPLTPDDRRLNRKERVHGVIIDNMARVYRFDSFSSSTSLINDNFNGDDIVVVGDPSRNLIVSFYSQLADGTTPVFSAVDTDNIILEDDLGNSWDVFGYAVSGPNQGQRLMRTESFMGYWFVWGTFYPEVEIYNF